MFNEWYDLIFDNFHLIVEKGEKIGVTEKAKKYYLSPPNLSGDARDPSYIFLTQCDKIHLFDNPPPTLRNYVL